MKDQLTIFESAQFGQIRISKSASGEPLFCLADVCRALDISNHHNVARRIDQEGVHRMDILTQGGKQQVIFVIELGMYETILRSDSVKAKPTVITKPNGNSIVLTTTKVTGKGQINFVNKFLNNTISEIEEQRKEVQNESK